MVLSQSEKIESKLGEAFFPQNQQVAKYDWQAQWIWMHEDIESHMMLARRSFELSSLPESATLGITASSIYQLYVNGTYINRGPARSVPHHQSFDILDLRNYLRIGENVITIRVHYQHGSYSYHHDGRAGLLAQLDMSSEKGQTSIITDNNWRVSPDPSWDNEAPRINRFQLVVNDKVDMRNQIGNWNALGFDDSQWQNAIPLMRNVGWPAPEKNTSPQALTPPWTSLVPRDIPYLIETDVQADNLIQAIQLDSGFVKMEGKFEPIFLSRQIDKEIARGIKKYTKNGFPLVIPPSKNPKHWFLLFDFGTVINGMPQFDVKGVSGTKVNVLAAPFVVDSQFSPEIVKSSFIDRIILSGERDTWEATYFKPTRYLGITIQSGNEPISINNIGIHQISYPFEKKGQIKSSEAAWVQQYVDASAKTISTCTTDAFTDNYRERRQYAQTGFYAALGNYWTFGDTALQRRYLVQVAQEQEVNGLMPAYAPLTGDDYMVILDSNCLWIRSLHNYLLYSGDMATARSLLPAAKKLMKLLHSYTDSLGMINNPPYPYWLDHAQNDRRGANFNLNGHYLGALEDFAKVMTWLGDQDGRIYQKRADLLRQSLQNHLWDQSKGLFADAFINGERSLMFSEHANGTALALNIATAGQAQKIAGQLLAKDNHNYIKRVSGITMVTPAMSYYLYKGLCEYGYVDEAFQMLQDRFDKMLLPNSNATLWEEWWLDATGRSGTLQKTSRSDAQTESAFPPALFAEYLLGFNPSKPGMKEIIIQKPNTGLNTIEATFPSPEGQVFVAWQNLNVGSGVLELEIPGKMEIKLDLESLDLQNGKSIIINGSSMPSNSGSDQYLILSKGSHAIQF